MCQCLCHYTPPAGCLCKPAQSLCQLCSTIIKWFQLMNKLFLPTSGKVLSTFQTFCPVGVQVAQTVVHFAHFQVQARKRGVLGWGCGCFVYVHIPERVCDCWLRSGVGDGILGKMKPIWAKRDPSGQVIWKVGKSALELGGKNSIIFN